MSTLSNEQWNTALEAVFDKAATDAAFRAKCLADPAAAVREAAGVEIPPGIRFADTAADTGILLPALGSDPEEITDSELLDNVAGGGAWGYVSIGDKNKACEA